MATIMISESGQGMRVPLRIEQSGRVKNAPRESERLAGAGELAAVRKGDVGKGQGISSEKGGRCLIR